MRVMQTAQPQAAWGKSQVLREQRLHPRARFLNPVPVDLDVAGARIEGEMVDISRTGAQLRADTLRPGQRLTGEFQLAGEAVRFSGVVANVREVPRGVGIRFDGAGDEMAVLAGVVERSIARGEDGRTLASMVRVLTWGDAPKVKVYGALTGHGWRNLMGAVGRFGARAIDLSEANWMDVGGIALCLLAQERHGIQVERCSRHVKQMMDVARMCGKLCGGECSPFFMGAR